ncbi:hypothetical protein AB0O28_01630 [Microbispora sp. NPDC088329]|uniref:hypothetical protein n=1 Tax=Microbispora sp. NPDC088329 TaxID=3154869 RepID=UPI00342FCD3F
MTRMAPDLPRSARTLAGSIGARAPRWMSRKAMSSATATAPKVRVIPSPTPWDPARLIV